MFPVRSGVRYKILIIILIQNWLQNEDDKGLIEFSYRYNYKVLCYRN